MSYVRSHHHALGDSPGRVTVAGTARVYDCTPIPTRDPKTKKAGIAHRIVVLQKGNSYIPCKAMFVSAEGKTTYQSGGTSFSMIADHRTAGPHVANTGGPGTITTVDHRTKQTSTQSLPAVDATSQPPIASSSAPPTDPTASYDPTSYAGGAPTDQQLDQLIAPTMDPSLDIASEDATPDATSTTATTSSDTIFGIPKMPLLIGAAGVAAYLIFIRKK